jgi:HEPN pEK499 p136
MEYEDLVRDFVSRTRANLAVIDRLHEQDSTSPFYEVTQLLNSLLGLVVIPFARLLDDKRGEAHGHLLNDRLSQRPITETGVADFPLVRLNRTGGRGPSNLYELLRGVRNAIAHADIDFNGSGGQIAEVILHCQISRRQRKWDMTFTVRELRVFVEAFADEVNQACRLARGQQVQR